MDVFRGIISERLAEPGKIKILDPFAGTGRIHQLQDIDPRRITTVGVEIQPQYADLHEQTLLGDATQLPPRWTNTFDFVVTSPTYGNRFADRHHARDGSVRRGYTHDLRAMTGDENLELEQNHTGRYYFHHEAYRTLHEAAYRQVWRVLKKDGRFVLNVSDSIKKNEVVQVAQWHLDTCTDMGFKVVKVDEVGTQRLRYGANGSARVAYEMVYTMEKPK
jgi:tRNA G10  N-methylase Trm11